MTKVQRKRSACLYMAFDVKFINELTLLSGFNGGIFRIKFDSTNWMDTLNNPRYNNRVNLKYVVMLNRPPTVLNDY